MTVRIGTTQQIGSVTPPVTITTTTLPNATVGVAYSVTLAATGGFPPYTWSASGVPAGLTMSTTGVLSGTPTTTGTGAIVVTAVDTVSSSSAATSLSLTVAAAGTLLPPSVMYPGNIGLQSFAFGWAPPTSGPTPTSYNVYRDGGSTPVYTGIVPDSLAMNYPWVEDRGLANGSSHTWYVTSVLSGSPPTESSPGQTLSATTLAAGPSATPAPPAALTWISPVVLPNSGTTWTVTNPAVGAVSGTGTLGNVGCSLQWAISGNGTTNTGYAPGDLIVMTAGVEFPTDNSGNGFVIPYKANPNSKWTYVISSEDPVYKSGGALPAYSENTGLGAGVTDYSGTGGNWVTPANAAAMPVIKIMAINGSGFNFQPGANYLRFVGLWIRPPLGGTGTMTLSAAPAAGATTATITGTGFPGPTGNNYLLIFSNLESRQVNLTNGQTALTWAQPLTNAATTTLNWQSTNWAVSYGVIMPTFPVNGSVTSQTPCESIYFDRCRVGTDPATFYATTNAGSLMVNGIHAYGNHILIHQCHIEGISDNFWMQGSYYGYKGYPTREAHGVLLNCGAQNVCIRNSFVSAVTECVFGGGSYIPQNFTIQDITISNNFMWKNPAWFNIGASYDLKNHVEFKDGQRINNHHNVFAYNATGNVDTQSGRMMQYWATDQNTGKCPWVASSDVDVHDNLYVYSGCPIYFAGAIGGVTGAATSFPWNVACRYRFMNNMVHMNVPTTAAGSTSVPYCIQTGYNVPDSIYDHNTIIINRISNSNWNSSGQYASGMYNGFANGNSVFYWPPTPSSPNGRQIYADRCTVTNNIFDGSAAFSGSGMSFGGMTAFGTMFPSGASGAPNAHSTVANNLYINDATSYTGNDFPAVGYTNVGFTSWVDSATVPLPPNISNWNVTVGSHATASTTGTALGAKF